MYINCFESVHDILCLSPSTWLVQVNNNQSISGLPSGLKGHGSFPGVLGSLADTALGSHFSMILNVSGGNILNSTIPCWLRVATSLVLAI